MRGYDFRGIVFGKKNKIFFFGYFKRVIENNLGVMRFREGRYFGMGCFRKNYFLLEIIVIKVENYRYMCLGRDFKVRLFGFIFSFCMFCGFG